MDELNAVLLAGEEAQMKLLQRQSGEICDQMILCMDMHMGSVYTTMCQHFHPAEAVEEPTLKVEQLRQRATQLRQDALRCMALEVDANAKYGEASAAAVHCSRALQLKVDLVQRSIKTAQAKLAQVREELEEERSRAAEFEGKRRALRRQRLHRLELLADNTRSLNAEVKHLRELREVQKEMLAEHHRASAGSNYSQGEEYVLLRQSQNGLQQLHEKQDTLERMLASLEEIVITGGGSIAHQAKKTVPREGGEEQSQRNDDNASLPQATTDRIVALEERSRQVQEQNGWKDPIELAFDARNLEADENILFGDDSTDDKKLLDRSRIQFDTRLVSASSPALFTPSLPKELLRVGKNEISDRTSPHRRQRTPQKKAGLRVPPSTPVWETAAATTTRTPFSYHSHTALSSQGLVSKAPPHRYSPPSPQQQQQPIKNPPLTTSALASLKEEAHSLLRAELVKALDGAAGAPSQRNANNVVVGSSVSSGDALQLESLLRSRAKNFKLST